MKFVDKYYMTVGGIAAVATAVYGVYWYIFAGHLLLNILDFLLLLGWFTFACLLVNEIRSILENLVECGYNMPAFLVKGVAVTEKLHRCN